MLLSVQVGDRSLAMVQAVLYHIAQLLVPGCVPLCLASCELTPAVSAPDSNEWLRLRQGLAAVYTGDGSGSYGSRVVTERGPTLPRVPVTTAADGLRKSDARRSWK